VTIEVLANGTEVLIDREIPAVIRGVTIYSEFWIKYLCIWWDERKRHEEWLTPDEFEVKERRMTSVYIKKKNA
jgi:hypothetical protein